MGSRWGSHFGFPSPVQRSAACDRAPQSTNVATDGRRLVLGPFFDPNCCSFCWWKKTVFFFNIYVYGNTFFFVFFWWSIDAYDDDLFLLVIQMVNSKIICWSQLLLTLQVSQVILKHSCRMVKVTKLYDAIHGFPEKWPMVDFHVILAHRRVGTLL